MTKNFFELKINIFSLKFYICNWNTLCLSSQSSAIPSEAPPSDITNKMETVLPNKQHIRSPPPTTENQPKATISTTSANISKVAVIPPKVDQTPPVIPTSSNELASRVSQRESPPLRHRRRNRINRAQRAKTLDLSEISDVLRRRKNHFKYLKFLTRQRNFDQVFDLKLHLNGQTSIF